MIFFNEIQSVKKLFPKSDYKTHNNLFLLITKIRKSLSTPLNNCKFFLSNSLPSIPNYLELNKTFKFNLIRQKKFNAICFINRKGVSVFDKMFERFYLGYLKDTRKSLTYYNQKDRSKKNINIDFKMNNTNENDKENINLSEFEHGFLIFDNKNILLSRDEVRYYNY